MSVRSAPTIVGTARNVASRLGHTWRAGAGRQETILSFRIEVVDQDGNVVGNQAVQMSGLNITGALADGDEVEVRGGRRRRGVLHADRVYNHTTQAEVRASPPWIAGGVFGMLFIILVIILMAAIIYVGWTLVSDAPAIRRISPPAISRP